MELDIHNWIIGATSDDLIFRKAVHTVLAAISGSEYLQPKMVMKGGMLLGIRYNSSRFTTDIDFSSSVSHLELDEEQFRDELNSALLVAEAELMYGVHCVVQRLSRQPRDFEGATFPSYSLSIGYAHITDRGAMNRLDRLECPTCIKIDYSFNEDVSRVEDITFSNADGAVKAYNIYAVVAEKYRSILQQIVRHRNRRQDIYDLYYLITSERLNDYTTDEKLLILRAFIEKSVGRFVGHEELISRDALSTQSVIDASRSQYHLLAMEVNDFPDFDVAYGLIKTFYESLPWEFYD